MKSSCKRLFFLITCLTVLASCTTNDRTTIQSTWKETNFDASAVNKVLLIGLFDREAARRRFEGLLRARLSGEGIDALSSLDGVNFSDKVAEESMRAAFGGQNIDVVIVSHLIAVDENVNYVPAKTQYIPRATYVPGGFYGPYSYYGNFYGYYARTYDEVHTSGYLEMSKVVRIETNVYETQNNNLVWSAISRTFNPTSERDVIISVTDEIFRGLKKDGFF